MPKNDYKSEKPNPHMAYMISSQGEAALHEIFDSIKEELNEYKQAYYGGFIKRCPCCNSLKIRYDLIYRTDGNGDNGYSFIQHRCCSCSWKGQLD